jgi:RNA binding exosome subunit
MNSNYPQYDRWEYQDIAQNRFIELVNIRADKETVSEFIKNWLTRKDISHPEFHREKLQARRKFNTELYVYVDKNIVTKKQRLDAIDTIKIWIKIIDDLKRKMT